MSELEKGKQIFVTNDTAITSGKGKLHDVDRSAMNPTRGIVIESVEQLQAMAEAAHATLVRYRLHVSMQMTPERASRIRRLRVDEGYSWRALAAQIHREWGVVADWRPPSNQIAGIALCEAAAALLGEDAWS